MSLDKDYLKDLFTDEVKGCLKSDGDPVGTAANAVSEHNTSEDAHSDIRGLIELEYDELRSHAASDKHITPEERINWNGKSNFSGSYNDLSDKPTIPTVPTKVSELQNDAGYLTEHQDISGLTAHTENGTVHITAAERTKWNKKSDFSGSYNDLSDKPTIPTVPTKVSELQNDSGYLTEHQDISGKVNTSDLTAHTGNSTVHITADERAKWGQAVTDVGILSEEIVNLKNAGIIIVQDGDTLTIGGVE